MITPQADSEELSDDIFDHEIIYCVTKVTIEPFVTCIFDKEKYEAGNDYEISYIESTTNRYLCIAFGEELTPSQSENIIVKGTHHLMGTVLIAGHKGGSIHLNNPLTNISTMYYSYINSLNECPSFKKVDLIPENERHSTESQKDKIYISSTDTIFHKLSESTIERVPIGSWFSTRETYPKRVLIKGWGVQDVKTKIDDHEFMTSSLPAINEDEEIVEVIVHSTTPIPIVEPPPDEQEDPVHCCCVKYFLIPLYNWFVTKLKSLKSKPHQSDQSFIDIELP